jgi:hypothetical protein
VRYTERDFERLAGRARQEAAPIGDVSEAAVRRIWEYRMARSSVRPMLVFAGVYGLICLVVLIAGYQFVGFENDPMGNFFSLAREIAP